MSSVCVVWFFVSWTRIWNDPLTGVNRYPAWSKGLAVSVTYDVLVAVS